MDQWSKTTADPKVAKQFCAKQKIFVPIVVPGLATGSSSSSTSSSSASFPEDASGEIPSSPATQRSDDTNVQALRNRWRDLPAWVEEFTDDLEDKEVPA